MKQTEQEEWRGKSNVEVRDVVKERLRVDTDQVHTATLVWDVSSTHVQCLLVYQKLQLVSDLFPHHKKNVKKENIERI